MAGEGNDGALDFEEEVGAPDNHLQSGDIALDNTVEDGDCDDAVDCAKGLHLLWPIQFCLFWPTHQKLCSSACIWYSTFTVAFPA